jgi:hypothetical protein
LEIGVDLTDPEVAKGVALALDGFIRTAFTDAPYLAVTAIRARAYVIPLAAVLVDILDGQVTS